MDLVCGMDDSMRSRKRKSSDEDLQTCKRQKATPPRNLLDLSDCALLHILNYLHTTDLFNLSRCCNRLKLLITHKSLWTHVDARDAPNCRAKTILCIENVGKHTRHLQLAAAERCHVVLPKGYLKSFAYSRLCNLTVLALEHQYIDGKECPVSKFPPSLRELSLKCSFVNGETFFFRQSSQTMSNLKVLIMDRCRWLTVESLLPISKYPQLEILSLYACMRMNDSLVSYLSLTGRFGFPSLKVVDLRFTCLGDQFVKSFYMSTTIQEVYFQHYSRSYRREREMRLSDIRSGRSEFARNSYFVENEVDDTHIERMYEFYEESVICKDRPQNISDNTFQFMRWMRSMASVPAPAPTVLYRYPYNKCECGFVPGDINSIKTAETSRPLPPAPSILCLIETRCPSVEKYDSCTLDDDSCWIFNREPLTDAEIDKFEHSVLYEPMSVWYARNHNHNWAMQPTFGRTTTTTYPKHRLVITIESNGQAITTQQCAPALVHRDITDDEIEDFIAHVEQGVHARDDPDLRDVDALDAILLRYESIVDEAVDRSPAFLHEMAQLLEAICDLNPCEGIRDVLMRHRLCVHDVLREVGDARTATDRLLLFLRNVRRYERRFWSYRVAPRGDDDVEVAPTRPVEMRPVRDVFSMKETETPLRKLSLRGFPEITDTLLCYLSTLELDLLDVTMTGVTAAGVRRFVSVNPRCRVVHESACACTPNLHF